MKRDWNSRSAVIIIGLILIVINLAGLNLFARLDLTDDDVYSLSDASIEILEDLQDPITVRAFFTADLPTPYSSNRRFLKDKLDDYRAYGGTLFQYQFEDPNNDEELRQQAAEFQIPPVQIQVIESDNVQLKNAYMGLVIQYAGSTETIPVVQDLTTLEYDISSAIRRITRSSIPVVGFLSGHGEPDPRQDMQTLAQTLASNYSVETVTLEDGTVGNPDVLLVVSPTDSIPPLHQRAIDTYIMEGGRVGFLLNGISADLQTAQASAVSVGLEEMLSAYGLGIKPDLIMDNQSSVITVQRRQGMFNMQQQIPYPFFPIATSFSKENMMVNRLSNVMFYYTSSVDTSIAVPEGVTRTVLARTSSRSQAQEGFFFIQPQLEQPEFSGGPFPLAVSVEGEMPSAFTDGLSGLPSRVVLVGDGDLLTESVLGAIQGNIEFGLNLVDWLAQDEALLGIRSKNVAARPLDETAASSRPWIKYGNMLLPVFIVIFFGVLRWRGRRRKQALAAR